MATISVYAEFPKVISADNLDLNPSNWSWHQCLAFPVTKLADLRLSLKPYKWIRFVTGVVVGAEGHLSLQQDSPTPTVNYDDALPHTSVDLYYHFLDSHQRSRMFPLDSYIDQARSVTQDSVSTRRMRFGDDVKARDGVCVVTGTTPYNCDAVHLLSHSKGDSYIKSFTTGRGPTSSDIIHDIDSVQNGLLLNTGLHLPLGHDFAILVTPNFAMDTDDVVQVTDDAVHDTEDVSPDTEDVVQDAEEKRFTSQLFDRNAFGRLASAYSEQAIQVPKNKSKWPPTVLFDAVYASAVIHHFCKLPKDFFKSWENIFYPDGMIEVAKTRTTQQIAEREERRRRRDNEHETLDAFDILRILPYIVAGPEQYLKVMKERQEAAAARDREELDAKVDSWRQSV